MRINIAEVAAEIRREARLRALSVDLVELLQLWRKEAACYRSGAMFESPVGELNRASAEVVTRFCDQLDAAIAKAEGREP